MNLRSRSHRGFAFVRFRWKKDALSALEDKDGFELKGSPLKIMMAVQNSFFTQDTGYITNELLDNLPERGTDFEPGMPDSHFETLRYQSRDDSDAITLKVSNLGHDGEITDQVLQDTFCVFGELLNAYRPFDKGVYPMKPRDSAFVRFLHKADGHEAMKALEQTWLMGRQIHITVPRVVENFSQNESRKMAPVL